MHLLLHLMSQFLQSTARSL